MININGRYVHDHSLGFLPRMVSLEASFVVSLDLPRPEVGFLDPGKTITYINKTT